MENNTQTRKHFLPAISTPEYKDAVTSAIALILTETNGCLSSTDSFDHAIEIAASLPKERELIVISSFMFHDSLSTKRTLSSSNIPDDEKDGVLLAKKIKAMLPNAKVYILSEHEPGPSEYVDVFIKKTGHIEEDVRSVLKLLLPPE